MCGIWANTIPFCLGLSFTKKYKSLSPYFWAVPLLPCYPLLHSALQRTFFIFFIAEVAVFHISIPQHPTSTNLNTLYQFPLHYLFLPAILIWLPTFAIIFASFCHSTEVFGGGGGWAGIVTARWQPTVGGRNQILLQGSAHNEYGEIRCVLPLDITNFQDFFFL